MLDTANINEIEYFSTAFPIAGVTSNPSILKEERRTN
ncbi:transaldolase family protein [Halalkalibacter lacteus]